MGLVDFKLTDGNRQTRAFVGVGYASHYLPVTSFICHNLKQSLSNRAESESTHTALTKTHTHTHTALDFPLRQHPAMRRYTPASPRAGACSAAATASQSVTLAWIQRQLWPQLTALLARVREGCNKESQSRVEAESEVYLCFVMVIVTQRPRQCLC